jgi:adenosyl cobinamide kinase/adenosyl cobinamide phosphate guanylyltransferase
MIFIFGGIFQGKKAIAEEMYSDYQIVKSIDNESYKERMILVDLEELVISLTNKGINVVDYFNKHVFIYEDIVIVGNEVGQGVVPIKKEHRILRDEIGFLYQQISKQSDDVYRVWNGIIKKVK